MKRLRNIEVLSSSSDKRYTVTLWEDGHWSCNCPAWVFKKKGRERSCAHTQMVQAVPGVVGADAAQLVTVVGRSSTTFRKIELPAEDGD